MSQNPNISLAATFFGWLVAFGTLSPVCVNAQAPAPATALSLDAAIRLAHEYNPEYRVQARWRPARWLSVEAHAAVFSRVLEVVQASGLLSGKTLGVDSTTLEANAAMRSIVRRDDGKGYEEWLEEVARASGIETPTRQDLAKLDRKRPKKGSNREWAHPHDPEARITKMKDGRTGLAHKFEQAVDMETGAVVAVTVQTMEGGDTASLPNTLDEAQRQLAEIEVGRGKWWPTRATTRTRR